jgi:glycosyltransferase involved in cell wall biosynthesis
MKILKVIHGYPRRYNAGSEVYSQMLCQGLAVKHDVHVFTREENPFRSDYEIHQETDPDDQNVTLHLINLLSDRNRYRYQHQELDLKFSQLLDKLQPDIVHIGHLNHLSTSLVEQVHQRSIPSVFTLHDYWLMCPRGQFMQRNNEQTLWKACSGQDDYKCATQCYSGYASGAVNEREIDTDYWTNWVSRRMSHMRNIVKLVDFFVAPSRYLYDRFVNDFNLPKNKMTYIDYGFDLKRFENPRIRAKGIQDLIQAFAMLDGNQELWIWGRHTQNTTSLKSILNALPADINHRVKWLGEYRNNDIISEVFNHVDCIVIPSIWVENSPLVIHEALQARLPVITANIGGMAEYVKHGVNGLLFEFRNTESLAHAMQDMSHDPANAALLGSRGYLLSDDKNIPDMPSHIKALENIYENLIR